MRKLELELHPEKTKFVNLWDGKGGFDFLGFHHRRTMQENGKGKIYPTTLVIKLKEPDGSFLGC